MDKLSAPAGLVVKSGNLRENWVNFRQRFEIYLEAGGFAEDFSEKAQACLLLHVIGEDALEIYNNFIFGEEADKFRLNVILDKFAEYCLPTTNETFERHKFFTCDQQKDQKIDQYHNELQTKAKSCSFGDLKDSLIRDRIICGILDDKMKEKLLQVTDLTLAKTLKMCRAYESTKERMKEMAITDTDNPGTAGEVCAIKSHTNKNKKFFKPRAKNTSHENTKHADEHVKVCGRCGSKHTDKCPAVGTTCNHCGRKDHFAKMCFYKKGNQHKKSVHMVNSEDNYDSFCIDTIDVDNSKQEWKHSLITNGTAVNYKLDTGSHVNILSKQVFLRLKKKSKIHQTSIKLTSYTGDDVPIEGTAVLDVISDNKTVKLMFVIAKYNVASILGLTACDKLGLIQRVYSVEKTRDKNEHVFFKEYRDVFTGLGCLPGEHSIEIDESIKPVIHACRKIPFALHDKVKDELNRMVELQVICQEENPTDWVNSLVVVPKPNKEQIRLCLDPRDLNKAIKREHYKLPTREEIMSQFSNAKFLSKLDASSGFWQMKLDEKSSKLTCFNTPFGRYRFLRLPFGISSAPEVYHKAIHMIFEHIEGAVTMMDDLVVWGNTLEEHDQRLRQVLETARRVNLKLNRSKCIFGVTELTFIGDVISSEGLKPDPLKIQAIQEFEKPTCVKDIQRLIGMVNYLGRYLPDLSTITTPLRELLDKKNEFVWTQSQEDSFYKIKSLLSSSRILKFYDPGRPILVSADASKSGLGAVILQKYKNQWCPVAYASRAMLPAETRYAQIEKEILALTFACERFHQYLYGQCFEAETDHKPLINIFRKPLNDCPIRIQRFLLRLQKYSFTLTFTPGKDMFISDCLSRAFVNKTNECDISGENKIEVFVDMVLAHMSYTDERLQNIKEETKKDEDLQILIKHIIEGFPEVKNDCPRDIREYWNIRHDLTYIKGLIFKGERVVIPKSLRKLMLSKIHAGHLGMVKCCRRARDLMYWPGMNQCITDLVNSCSTCLKYRPMQAAEPLLPHQIPKYPWEKVGVDLAVYNNQNFLIMCDYFSSYPEVAKLSSTTSSAVIRAMKHIFATHGIPREVFSDNGPQFSSQEYKDFAKSFDFNITTSSPHFAQSNGLVEKSVGVIKNLLKKAEDDNSDFYMGLLVYRATSLSNGQSPAEILYGRRIRSNLPITEKKLHPSPFINFEKKKKEDKRKQKKYYDRRVKELPKLIQGDTVKIRDRVKRIWSKTAIVISEIAPRSYIVRTNGGVEYRRNRRDLLKCVLSEPFSFDLSEDQQDQENEPNINPRNPPQNFDPPPLRTRTGRIINKPKRLIEEK